MHMIHNMRKSSGKYGVHFWLLAEPSASIFRFFAYIFCICCRGLALGIALTVYGREEEADTLIEQMTRDQDPILRYGGMYALALAYSGTANNKAIRQLLHFAVSDVSDDVRRTAVLALGFVLYSEPEQVGSFLCFSFSFCTPWPMVVIAVVFPV